MTCTKVDKRVLMGFYAFCLLTPLFIFCSADGQEAKKKEKYVFSADFFSSRIPVWEEVLRPWKGKGDIRYLEIGVFEGRSFLWMLDNILTHPTARATAIDIFPRDSKTVFLNNLRISGAENRVETRVGRSEAELRRFEPGSFDLIYIDGSHLAADVLIDAVLSWPLLKNNGLMIFDDYSLQVESAPMELRPQVAIDALITAHRNDLEIVHSSWQLILRKKEGQAFALRLGQYEYEWSQANLYTAGMKDLIPLSDKEKELIGKLFMGREFGEVSFCPTPEMLHDPDFIRLKERLKLDLMNLA